jgi:hypothetical protein
MPGVSDSLAVNASGVGKERKIEIEGKRER